MDSDKKGAAVSIRKWQASAVKQTDTILLCSIIAILAWLAVAARFDPLRYTAMAGDDLHAVPFVMGSIAGWTGGDFRGIALIGNSNNRNRPVHKT
jgi:hypothetical protein